MPIVNEVIEQLLKTRKKNHVCESICYLFDKISNFKRMLLKNLNRLKWRGKHLNMLGGALLQFIYLFLLFLLEICYNNR